MKDDKVLSLLTDTRLWLSDRMAGIVENRMAIEANHDVEILRSSSCNGDSTDPI